MKHALVLVVAGVTLMGCMTTPPADPKDPPVPPPERDTCSAHLYASFVGKPATSPGLPPASRLIRYIRPDTIVTMDLAPARLNFMIDKTDTITSIGCG